MTTQPRTVQARISPNKHPIIDSSPQSAHALRITNIIQLILLRKTIFVYENKLYLDKEKSTEIK